MVPPWIVLRTREEGVQSRWSPENRNALPVISRDYIVVVNDAIGMKYAVVFQDWFNGVLMSIRPNSIGSQTNSNCETQFCASRVDGPAELKSRVALVTSGASGNAVHQHSCLQARHSKWSRQAAERVVRGQSACQRFSIARLSPAASPLISHRPEPEVVPSRELASRAPSTPATMDRFDSLSPD